MWEDRQAEPTLQSTVMFFVSVKRLYVFLGGSSLRLSSDYQKTVEVFSSRCQSEVEIPPFTSFPNSLRVR